jgi:hypothetical protein
MRFPGNKGRRGAHGTELVDLPLDEGGADWLEEFFVEDMEESV